MTNRIEEYIQYHVNSSRALDIDPQVEAIQYICNRFELNIEQRLWLCFLFSTNYCVPTTYFMYNEFPDFATVDVGRLQRWWQDNRGKLIFTTDRAWIRSRNQFVNVFCSYREQVRKWGKGQMSQFLAISLALDGASDKYTAYDNLRRNFGVLLFGRFTMFLYSELLYNVCGFKIGVRFDLREAESSRNGLVFALGLENVAYTGRTGKTLPAEMMDYLNDGLRYISSRIQQLPILPRHKTLWSIETTLCAYKKHKLNNRRWVGYYIERMRKEITKLEAATDKRHGGGICWLPLWQFRAETYEKKYLKEWQ